MARPELSHRNHLVWSSPRVAWRIKGNFWSYRNPGHLKAINLMDFWLSLLSSLVSHLVKVICLRFFPTVFLLSPVLSSSLFSSLFGMPCLCSGLVSKKSCAIGETVWGLGWCNLTPLCRVLPDRRLMQKRSSKPCNSNGGYSYLFWMCEHGKIEKWRKWFELT